MDPTIHKYTVQKIVDIYCSLMIELCDTGNYRQFHHPSITHKAARTYNTHENLRKAVNVQKA